MNIEDIQDLLTIKIIPIDALKPSENHDRYRADSLRQSIVTYGFWDNPLLVEKKNLVIMDGHHRLQVAKMLGLKQVPCLIVDYGNPYLNFASKHAKNHLCTNDVIMAGIKGELLDYKSTLHTLSIELIEIKIPLNVLKV